MTTSLIALLSGVGALIYAVAVAIYILKKPQGNEKMRAIAKSIREGANAYLNRQSATIAVFTVIIALLLYIFIPEGDYNNNVIATAGFVLGAIFSLLAGYVGMSVSVRANVRTAEAAKKGMKEALDIAFRGGSVTGMIVVGLSLVGVSGIYMILNRVFDVPVTSVPQLLIGFGFGASLISLFARVGGGIYTKAADVGADIVGKIEKDIPEDDPRNPAVIADNVGDNVGDCAGMGADLFETFAVTLIAAMILAASTIEGDLSVATIEYPLLLGAVGVVASLIGTFFVRLGKKKNIMNALYKGTYVAAFLSVVGFYFATDYLLGDMSIFYATIVGVAVTVLINIITEYYTSTEYSPVKKIADASETGAGTNIISGLAVGLESTLAPVILIVVAMAAAYYFGSNSGLENGIYGVAIAAVAMLSTTGMVIALDSYGPITDNAGGIAEMSKLPESTRHTTDALDAVGNTTKAVTKGYAISSAALAALVLFQAYSQELSHITGEVFTFDITNYKVIIGLFLGGMIPYLFAASSMKSVGKAAFKIVEEVRRQFREKKGILTGKEEPDYARCVDIVTKAALKEMIFPGLLAVLAPIIVGVFIGAQALGGFLAGIMVSGFMLAIQMCTGGGAWDNAKKLIESGHLGGKGSEAHKAAVVGDTVGDPYKDTAGPALNSLIKVINTIALLLAPIIAGISLW